jgi:hypothetical protein
MRPEPRAEEPAVIAPDSGQGGDDAPASESKPSRGRRKRVATPDAGGDREGRRLYLSEGVHFRLRMLAYQRGRKISEVAEEVLDRALPRWTVERSG